MSSKEELQLALEKLVQVIYTTIREGLERRTLQPQLEPYFRWKLREFEYGDTGIIKKSGEGQERLRPYWGRAARDVSQKVRKMGVYDDVLRSVQKNYQIEAPQSKYYLPTLVERVTHDILEGKSKTPAASARRIVSLLRDLNGESQEYRAEVHLKGLILQPRSIQLDDNARLRRPNRSDFERETPLSFAAAVGVRQLEDPTAFLHTRIYAKADSGLDLAPAMALQNEIDSEVAVLRLFRVGAVEYIRCSTSTDSIRHMALGSQTRGRLLGSDKYLITKEDVKSLKVFWSNMKKVNLPSSVYTSQQKEPDELSIAYDRYTDSLDRGIVEKRISSAVMGLEALYLIEIDELPYRLSMRVGKILSLIRGDYQPSEVRDNLKVAYKIRNKYVHGVTLKAEERKKLEEKELLKKIMDYLRTSIVALLVRRTSKKSLIPKIDDSFLDSNKEEEIKKLLFTPY